ncbi:alanine dehydrogenase [Canibacter sp. lx-72]|uniref:alanine dehydrogenase n=1 Tax=Canibacter zhuwentaonis TaxID=2837491 RepID=UPI001BDD4512|nr:alanine dehydrogenase [Canibacter zhuwentaonis]MBT1017917.1 alanine dehydrogenase [Canibacter zhuwentaonis]MBT1035080.1 alanine dehydrogenase [Canibacter zhuwentaonis]
MRVGVPTEIKNNENRVAITAAGVVELVKNGHEVLIQSGAGVGSSISDEEFRDAGAVIVDSADEVWQKAEMVLKVKEPIAPEYDRMRKGQVLFTYLHLAASKECTYAVIKSGTTAIAYETVQLPNRALPLLAPMSEVAGRLAPQIGAHHLLAPNGGRGLLLGGVTATSKANVVVIGGGAAGEQSARMAYGLGAAVTVIDISLPRLKQIEDIYNGGISTLTSNSLNITNALKDADLVIGSVLIPGEKAPKLVTDEMVAKMKPGSVLVDIAIDQGGCFENSRPTTHDDPTYKVHDSIYYCVANMPGAVPTTSTVALTNATLPYVVALANKGWVKALQDDESLAKGLNAHEGVITYKGVADAFPELESATVAEVLERA